jgi:hypothetical protein
MHIVPAGIWCQGRGGSRHHSDTQSVVLPRKTGGASEIAVMPLDGPSEHVVVEDGSWLFAIEADVFAIH